MERKYLTENNKMAFVCLILIHVDAFLMGFLYHNYLDYPRIIYYLLIAGGIALTVIGRIKYVESEKGHKIMLGGVAISYLTLLGSMYQKPFLYALTYLICITIILYRNKQMLKIGLVVACIGNAILTAQYFLRTDRILTFEVLTNESFVVISMIVAYAVVMRMNRQNNELLADVTEKAESKEKETIRIKNIVEKISSGLNIAKDDLEQLQEAIKESAESTNQISQSTMLTAESIQTQTLMVSEISEALSSVSNSVEHVKVESDNTMNSVQNGLSTVRDLETQANNVSIVNVETAKLTKDLENKAENISQIIDTILDISGKTNLLSLNASIEAAHAGDYGKGFAVVASEIRMLSDTTKKSAEEIRGVIEDLVANIKNASKNIDNTVESVEKQNELIKDTVCRFNEIQDAVNNVCNFADTVVSETKTSVNANNAIVDSISNLSATSEEVAAASENALSVSENVVIKMDETKETLDAVFALAEQL